MTTESPNPPPPTDPGPPPEPGPGATREEWHAYHRDRRDYYRAHRPYGWYGSGWAWWGWGWGWGVVLVLAGIYFLLSNLNLLNWVRGDVFWPIVVILFGVFLIVRRGRWWPR